MTRILLLTPQLPYPPQQGTSLRNWHILRWMAKYHDVTLLSFDDNYPDPVPRQLSDICAVETVLTPSRGRSERIARLWQSNLPDMANRLYSQDMVAALQQQLATESFDIVQIEGLEMAYLIPTIRSSSEAAIVLDCHNAETELQLRAYRSDSRQPRRWPAAAYSRVQAGRLAVFEAWAVRSADATVAVSGEDAAQLAALVPDLGQTIHVVPNSIDVREYETGGPTFAAGQAFDLVFSGKMDYRPNIDAVLWFADQIWPQLRSKYPHLTWGIVGQRPHAQLERLQTVEGITITGKVDSVRPYLESARVVVLPLRIGSGTRLKLIEAAAAAKPIVSTTIGAEGFPVTGGLELLLADSAAEFAGAVSRILDDQALAASLGKSARDLAASYDWRKVAPLFGEVYATAQQNRKKRAD